MKTIEVVAALIAFGGGFLACQRPAHKARGLLWEFPGGKVEPGETKAEAIIRECREELGLELSVHGEYTDVTHAYPDLTVHLTLMNCSAAGGEMRLYEHADARVVTVREALLMPFCPADQVFLREIERRNSEERTNMDHVMKAGELFVSGCNCAQAVVCAFAEEIGLPEETLMKLASSFGGGMGGMRETCGAVTGMFMVAGLLWGYEKPGDDEVKKAHYARIRSLAESFKEKNDTLVCRELLGLGAGPSEATPERRTDAYYRKRPCPELCACAARILASHLSKFDQEATD